MLQHLHLSQPRQSGCGGERLSASPMSSSRGRRTDAWNAETAPRHECADACWPARLSASAASAAGDARLLGCWRPARWPTSESKRSSTETSGCTGTISAVRQTVGRHRWATPTNSGVQRIRGGREPLVAGPVEMFASRSLSAAAGSAATPEPRIRPVPGSSAKAAATVRRPLTWTESEISRARTNKPAASRGRALAIWPHQLHEECAIAPGLYQVRSVVHRDH